MLNSFARKRAKFKAGPEHSASMRKDFTNLLDLLLSHLERHDFLLGSRACLADFALVGPFKGHFLLDQDDIQLEKIWALLSPMSTGYGNMDRIHKIIFQMMICPKRLSRYLTM